MIIDIIGVRGSGKSTAYKILKEKHNAFGREDRKNFTFGSWEDFTKWKPEFALAFLEECNRFRDFRNNDPLPRKTLKNYQAEFCLRHGLETLLHKDGIFAWDKGLLEVLTHTVLHSNEDIHTMTKRIIDSPLYSDWPNPRRFLWIKSKQAFSRAKDRTRNYQWDEITFARMLFRHTVFVTEFLKNRPGVHKIKNDDTLEILEKAIDAARVDEK